MKISFIERNGRRYAYTCTSRRIPGRKNPVSEMTYIGVVDPDTGEIIPKRSRESEPAAIPFEVDTRNLGDALLVMSVAERLGITEDLKAVFGEHHRMILAIALAEAVRPSPTDLLDAVLRSSAIPELLSLEPSEISKKNVMRAVNSIDHDSMNEFFRLRWRKSSGKALVFSRSVSLSDGYHDTLGDLSGLTGADNATVCMVTDADGSLIGLSLVQHPPSDISGAIEVMERMKSAGIDSVYVSDTSVSASLRMDELVLHDLDFIIPYSVASPQFSQMSHYFNDLSDSIYRREFDGNTYQMKTGSVALLMDGGRPVLISQGDPRFGEQGASMKSFMVSDPRINRNTIKSMDNLVRSLKSRLNGMTSDDPDMALSMAAGQLAPLFRFTRESDGTLSVSVKRNAMARFRENAGRALILTRSSSWDDVIQARETLMGINTVTGQFYKGSKWVVKYVGKDVDVESQMFVEFIALVIYDSIRRTLESCGEGPDVDEALFIASTFRKSTVNGQTVYSPMNRRLRKVFEMFELEPYVDFQSVKQNPED